MTTPSASRAALQIATRLIRWQPPELADVPLTPDQQSQLALLVARTIDAVGHRDRHPLGEITLNDLHETMSDTSRRADTPAETAAWLEIAIHTIALHITAVNDTPPAERPHTSQWSLDQRLRNLPTTTTDQVLRPEPPRTGRANPGRP